MPIRCNMKATLIFEFVFNNAFLVTDPTYVAEYFIPFTKLIDKDGIEVTKTTTIGFDVTLDDNDVVDPVRNRAVWSNTGSINESWDNMDGCGTFNKYTCDFGDGSAPSVSTTVLNPLVDFTTINYTLPQSQFIEIVIFDQLGRKIETLIKSNQIRYQGIIRLTGKQKLLQPEFIT